VNIDPSARVVRGASWFHEQPDDIRIDTVSHRPEKSPSRLARIPGSSWKIRKFAASPPGHDFGIHDLDFPRLARWFVLISALFAASVSSRAAGGVPVCLRWWRTNMVLQQTTDGIDETVIGGWAPQRLRLRGRVQEPENPR